MKRILFIFLAALMLCSCTFNFTPGSDNPSETPSTEPDNTPSTDKPNANIPDIPGAPAINTDENYIRNYRSQATNTVYGYLGVTIDAFAIMSIFFDELNGYWYNEHGVELINPNDSDFKSSVKLNSGVTADFSSSTGSDGFPHVDFSISIPGISLGNEYLIIWGTCESNYVSIISKLDNGDIDLSPAFNDSKISIIVELFGNRYSFVTNDLDISAGRIQGTVYINGIRYDVNSLLSSN